MVRKVVHKTFSKDEIELKKIHLEKERVFMIAQASTYMFFIFLLVGLTGLMLQKLEIEHFFFLLFLGILILLVSSHPYLKTIKDEKDFLDSLLKKK